MWDDKKHELRINQEIYPPRVQAQKLLIKKNIYINLIMINDNK